MHEKTVKESRVVDRLVIALAVAAGGFEILVGIGLLALASGGVEAADEPVFYLLTAGLIVLPAVAIAAVLSGRWRHSGFTFLLAGLPFLGFSVPMKLSALGMLLIGSLLLVYGDRSEAG